MAEVNGFNFSKYDVGGNGAIAGDNKLTGAEIHLAAKDGWTIWDGFKNGEQAVKTEEAINALFTKERYNNDSLQPDDKRKHAPSNFMKWALGNYNTDNIVGKTSKGDITTIQVREMMPVSPEEGWEKDGISTYSIKDNGDGTTEITHLMVI